MHSYKYTLWALHKELEKLVDIDFVLAGADFTNMDQLQSYHR